MRTELSVSRRNSCAHRNKTNLQLNNAWSMKSLVSFFFFCLFWRCFSPESLPIRLSLLATLVSPTLRDSQTFSFPFAENDFRPWRATVGATVAQKHRLALFHEPNRAPRPAAVRSAWATAHSCVLTLIHNMYVGHSNNAYCTFFFFKKKNQHITCVLIIFKIPKLWCNLTNQSGLSKKDGFVVHFPFDVNSCV